MVSIARHERKINRCNDVSTQKVYFYCNELYFCRNLIYIDFYYSFKRKVENSNVIKFTKNKKKWRSITNDKKYPLTWKIQKC